MAYNLNVNSRQSAAFLNNNGILADAGISQVVSWAGEIYIPGHTTTTWVILYKVLALERFTNPIEHMFRENLSILVHSLYPLSCMFGLLASDT